MKIINLQQYPVVLFPRKGSNPITFNPEGPVQVRMDVKNVTENGIIKDGYWTHTRNLPKPEENTIYIVSSLVAMYELYSNNRTDLVFPWGLIRNVENRVIGCKALCRPRKKILSNS
jgi:hypothetical protein